MAEVLVTPITTTAKTNNPLYDVSATAWNQGDKFGGGADGQLVAYDSGVTRKASWTSGLTFLAGVLQNSQAVAAVSTDGLVLATSTPATAGAQKYSPRTRYHGSGWKTNATAAAVAVDCIVELQPVQGAAAPSFNLVWSGSIAGGGYTALLTLSSAGALTALSALSGDGTQVAPGFAFTAEPTLGMFRSGVKKGSFSANNLTIFGWDGEGVRIGTPAISNPATTAQLHGATDGVDSIWINSVADNSNVEAELIHRRARGTHNVPVNVAAGDLIGKYLLQPVSNGSYQNAAKIEGVVGAGAFTNGNIPPTQWNFYTTAADTAAALALTIDEAQQLVLMKAAGANVLWNTDGGGNIGDPTHRPDKLYWKTVSLAPDGTPAVPSQSFLNGPAVGYYLQAADVAGFIGRRWVQGRNAVGTLTNYIEQIGSNSTTDYDITTATDYGGLGVKPSILLTGNTTSLYGQTIKPSMFGNSGTRTATNLVGLYIEAWQLGANAASANTFGLYLGAQTTGTNKYGGWIDGPTGNTSGENVTLHLGAPVNGGSGTAKTLDVVGSGYFSTALIVGATPATAGDVRARHGFTLQAKNTGAANRILIDWGNTNNDVLMFGEVNLATSIRCSLGTPGALVDGQWWVEFTGVTPNRQLRLAVRDGGVTYFQNIGAAH